MQDVDRRSFAGAYKIIHGMPRNPVRRTGLAGRGVLRRWGPNHEVEVVVTRWATTDDGSFRKKNNLPVLEVLVFSHGSDDEEVGSFFNVEERQSSPG